MPHPLQTAYELLERFAPLCSDRDVALKAVESMLPFATGDERACADCGATFYLTEPQREFFRARGMKEPVRCLACRQARKQARGF